MYLFFKQSEKIYSNNTGEKIILTQYKNLNEKPKKNTCQSRLWQEMKTDVFENVWDPDPCGDQFGLEDAFKNVVGIN